MQEICVPPGNIDIESLVDEIRSETRSINIVSFSGGKDSTTVLRLVLRALAGQSGKRLYVVTSDTLMEIPYFKAYVDGVKSSISNYFQAEGIPGEVVTVCPNYCDSFWVSTLGRGYPAAHMGFRWCTGKLKIDPISNYTRDLVANSGDDWKVFIGVRSAESPLRARIYPKKQYKANHYAPILDWTSYDVWEFLLSQDAPWGDHSKLTEVYRYASDECVYGEKQGVCVGNARYGCWACPLQKVNQLDMIGYHTGDVTRYKELKRFKRLLSGTANKRGMRSRIRRNLEDGCGPFLVSIRKILYRELKITEQRTGWSLITPQEEQHIFRHWEVDERIHNIPDSSQMIMWDVGASIVDE